MKLYKTLNGIVLGYEDSLYEVEQDWDTLVNRDHLYGFLLGLMPGLKTATLSGICAPVGGQEIWAAGVTYSRSMEARMEESKESGAADLYDRVYHAARPELFFKSAACRVSGPGEPVYIRKDSAWNVPEPELTLFINSNGNIQGYTAGNDMSSRSIEGENALYLPQAKIYDRSAAIGPCLYVPESPVADDTEIAMSIFRKGETMYHDAVKISRMKRKHEELAGYLFRETSFEHGCYLMTGTCLVPPNEFTLKPGDVVEISIDAIGTLKNTVSHNSHR
ncbi:fumarylacetoacetate hydrolase family protein [Hufsiella ginkgonis]|uniref:2-hydroxyhepta-2,4-diene-1,7-dioate isomerase n=1 Tax=Hufsiella ginkgonis TaxID=2695274 RepID=A0A7K1XYB8_9SPHI|nr:fumarylacetoacetate hydrolase family protein [Hufsiella ginkgonis]MXV15739.1 2-hydroxyhepta-2,4-diene-1,7-dioate isomerase [Hufsiella ginkgonis]